jgi:hypothetical protein
VQVVTTSLTPILLSLLVSYSYCVVDETTLGPGESLTISTFFGSADEILDVPVIARRILQRGFVQYKLSRTREIIRQITAGVETNTGNKLFDRHVQQMFLDNSLRGGIPVILGDTVDDQSMKNVDEDRRLKVYHVFSRIHGDLERDYNDFVLSSTFFSQVRLHLDGGKTATGTRPFIPTVGLQMYLTIFISPIL